MIPSQISSTWCSDPLHHKETLNGGLAVKFQDPKFTFWCSLQKCTWLPYHFVMVDILKIGINITSDGTKDTI